ncbi:hypothetical protein APF79_09130 [bacterium BRH_c32]|nr:MAG: hypothetical protein APF79_09130 [bacterium BRH_c32]
MSEIVIYQTQDRKTQVEVQFEEETCWLNQSQLEDLFEANRTSILKRAVTEQATADDSQILQLFSKGLGLLDDFDYEQLDCKGKND